MKYMWLAGGILLGLVSLSIARGSVPNYGSESGVSGFNSKITDDTAIYQKLSEIRVQRTREINFDPDISRLSSIEARYREKLPAFSKKPRYSEAVQRVSKQKYNYSE